MIPSILHALLDVAYPRICAGCAAPAGRDAMHFCWDCFSELQLVTNPFCTVCGDPADGRVDHEYVCSLCRRSEPYFDRARSVARFRGPMKNALHAFKYGGQTCLTSDFVPWLRACVATHYAKASLDAVAFVPLYPVKDRERTYNQAKLLARELAPALGLPFLPRCISRNRPTVTQTNLSARERSENVKGAFDVLEAKWIEGRRLLLVDDVMTTGATVGEVSRVLKKAGAAGVYVVTVARG